MSHYTPSPFDTPSPPGTINPLLVAYIPTNKRKPAATNGTNKKSKKAKTAAPKSTAEPNTAPLPPLPSMCPIVVAPSPAPAKSSGLDAETATRILNIIMDHILYGEDTVKKIAAQIGWEEKQVYDQLIKNRSNLRSLAISKVREHKMGKARK